jgi:hypothetical protein
MGHELGLLNRQAGACRQNKLDHGHGRWTVTEETKDICTEICSYFLVGKPPGFTAKVRPSNFIIRSYRLSEVACGFVGKHEKCNSESSLFLELGGIANAYSTSVFRICRICQVYSAQSSDLNPPW